MAVNEAPALPAWNSEPRLSIGRLVPLLFRSFFLQGSWSFERMQSVGWASILAGEGRRLAGSDQAAGFLKRHLAYFNTNPVTASYLIGGVIRLEEEIVAGRMKEDDVSRFKRGLVGPLAAWGDTFFWASLRPAATAIGVATSLLWGAWGVLVYLLAYNVFHLYYRVRGLSEGYRWGPEIPSRLARSVVKTRAGWVRGAGLLGAGILISLSAGRTVSSREPLQLLFPALGFAAFLVLRRRAGMGTWLGFVAILVGLVYAWVRSGR